ncbi:MarR family winged helix-turn-helix transcriptional regulator [Pseudonocardia sp. RS010]|uniref:MarR family winged helix-turn-helix transcriptional regulator n=1 Tax=Pseudonocardia sp. RS010 TaxID=3385979 RepID=UPI0039A1B417
MDGDTDSQPGDGDPGSPMRRILERNPAALSPEDIATAGRVPLTMIGSRLRETNATAPLTAPQSLVLSQLTAADALPVTELAAADGRAVSTMTEIVRRLAAAGLVTKHDGIDDRRQVLVSITPAGRDALAGNLRLRHERLTARIAALPDHERVALAAALPALWKLAEVDPDTWPRVKPRPEQRGRRSRRRGIGRPTAS